MRKFFVVIFFMACACSDTNKVDTLVTKYNNVNLKDSSEAIISKNNKSASYSDLFKEFCKLVEDNFYSKEIIKKEFVPLKEFYTKRVDSVNTDNDFLSLTNEMLQSLKTSHTYYLTPNDVEYYYLSDVFSSLPNIKELFADNTIQYPTVGISTEKIEGKDFITCVLAGSTAQRAGLLKGDEIIAVNEKPYHAINSLKENIGRKVVFSIKRTSSSDTQMISVIPELLTPSQQFIETEKASITTIKYKENQIGYIHIFSYAGQQYHDILTEAISTGILKNTDALIIDLRYGLGGANPSYLNIFNPNVPKLVSKDNSGNTYHYDPQWRKPTVFLVNKATRSGKEILAYCAKKFKLATVIGESTAGAVIGGTLRTLSNGDLLYIASRSVEIDGVTLEGVGVKPDIEVLMDIRYCEDKDDQLEKAIEYLGNRF